MNDLLIPLSSDRATLELAGGKGSNLSQLVQAGFRVPPCLALATMGYSCYVEVNGLAAVIQKSLAALSLDDPDSLAAASAEIRKAFSAGKLPADIKGALEDALEWLSRNRLLEPQPGVEAGALPLAVRSSATAEDLPDLSFAGQQETYLNVIGIEALRRAVVKCWSSLWTARAIGYRQRNGIPHDEAAVAILIQEMVPSDSSGILFTANPLTGRRTEAVIDATVGLGEALVAGQVEPDHYVVDSTRKIIVEKRLGAKALAIRSRAGGGIETITFDGRQPPAISDETVIELVSLGSQVADLFGAPQDIEWALSGGSIYLLQSRPITSLFPLPTGMAEMDGQDLRVMISFGAIQGMLDPMTPLGRDTIMGLFAGGGRIFDYNLTPQSQRVILAAGERLFVDLTPPLRHKVGRKVAVKAMGLVEPGISAVMADLLQGEQPAQGVGLRPRTAWRLLSFLLPTAARLIWTMLRPDERRRQAQQLEQRLLERNENCFAAADTLAERVACFERLLFETFPAVLPGYLPAIAGGMASLNAIKQIAKRLTLAENEELMVARGMPHNVTTEMDLSLWSAAKEIKADGEAEAVFASAGASELAALYLRRRLPAAAQRAVDTFVQRYGMRGTAEIDLGRPRWREEPTPVMRSLKSYLGIDDGDLAPDVVFERGVEAAAEAESRLLEAAMRTRLGRAKGWLIRFFAGRMRALAGLREGPKFLIVRLLGMAREALLASGQELGDQGVFEAVDDLFFLHLAELEELSSVEAPSREHSDRWRELVARRRQDYERERRRGQIPRLMLSDGRAFYEGVGEEGADDENRLVGSPVSPGVAEGVVRVVFDPAEANLQPGEILVCPGTDPAWTPLFLTAGGLVTEVGGLMTHGSVVAREYGIPAVVGVREATKRLVTGMRVRIDGATGVINCEL